MRNKKFVYIFFIELINVGGVTKFSSTPKEPFSCGELISTSNASDSHWFVFTLIYVKKFGFIDYTCVPSSFSFKTKMSDT